MENSSHIKRRIVRTLGLLSAVAIVGMLAMQTKKLFAGGANGPWGDTTKMELGIVLQSGQAISAWTGAGRSDETGNNTVWMTAVGDGTYQYQTSLVPNALYNFIFLANPKISTGGLTAGATLAEPVPNSGSDAGTFLSTRAAGDIVLYQGGAVGASGPGSVGYGSVAGDGRRVLTMPDLTTGDTVYIFNNFASTPRGAANYTAAASSSAVGGRVKLTWGGCLGAWGAGTPAADCLGGGYQIFRGTGTTSSHPFTLQTTLDGFATSYVDASVPESVWYYYIIVASDSYTSMVVNPSTKVPFAQLARTVPADGTSFNNDQYQFNDKQAKPATAVPVIFKVENMDEEYVKQHGNIVWMTPWGEDGRVYPYKVPGLIIKVKVPGGTEG